MRLHGFNRLAAVAASLAGAIVLIINSAVPAQAGSVWTTTYWTVRDVKAQACRLAHYDGNGTFTRDVYFRLDNRKASVGGRPQLRVWEPRDDFRRTFGPGDYVAKGSYDRSPGRYFTEAASLRVSMRTRTKFGVSRWSKWYYWSDLARCNPSRW